MLAGHQVIHLDACPEVGYLPPPRVRRRKGREKRKREEWGRKEEEGRREVGWKGKERGRVEKTDRNRRESGRGWEGEKRRRRGEGERRGEEGQ